MIVITACATSAARRTERTCTCSRLETMLKLVFNEELWERIFELIKTVYLDTTHGLVRSRRQRDR